MTDRTAPVSRSTAPHYTWASVCDGWRLIDTPGLRVVEERVPPGTGEMRHHHNEARQFFYVLSGAAVLEMEGREHQIPAGSGIEVAPGVRHKHE
jgi:mannose-6-phosphate isomerase-like protein (cupin superfamily)